MTAPNPFLSMCAYCREVRDPLGRWKYVNQGLLDWLKYRLSHGICPACFQKHFPEFYREKIPCVPVDAEPPVGSG